MNDQLPTENSCFQKRGCKTLFIGLDAADWKLVSSKVAFGGLPHLSSLMAHGVSGPLRSIYPLFSPALWATIATGKRPYDHGITGFTLPDDAGMGLRPYSSASRRSPAIWNMLSASHKTANIVGWWTTAPAEPIQGAMVDETFRIAHHPLGVPWQVAPKSLFPESLAELVAPERVHPQQLSEALLRFLVPKLYEIDPSNDFRIAAIAKILAEDLTTLQVTLRLMKSSSWDFTALYLIGLDSLSHLAMRYRDPAFPGENERDCDLYGKVIDRAYELYDTWIGHLLEAAGEEATVMVASDHGFYHDKHKPVCLGIEETAPAIQHAPIGTIIMKGPLLREGASLAHATILDLCPTLLTFLELPVGRDMPGNVLQEAFSKKPIIKTISSWNNYWQPSPLVTAPSPEATEAALRQLISLGYLQEMPSNKQAAVQDATCNQLVHLALSLLHDERLDQAIPLLKHAWQQAKQGKNFLSRTDILGELAAAYFRVGEKRQAAACFHRLVRYRRRDAQAALQVFWSKAAAATTPNLSFVEAWEVRRLIARANLEEGGMHFITTLAHFLAHPNEHYLTSLLAHAEKHPEDSFANLNAGFFALEAARHKTTSFSKLEEKGILYLQRVIALRPDEAEPLNFLAEYYAQTGHFKLSEKYARDALDRNSLHRPSWLTLATTLIHQGRWEEAWCAAQQAKRSVLQRSNAYTLLATIAAKGKKEPARAKRYLAMAKKSEAWFKKRREQPASLVQQFYNIRNEEVVRTNRARQQKKLVDGPRDSSDLQQSQQKGTEIDSPIIVTGLPRSGTSLVMQMLQAGGIPIDTDHLRQADEHNPRGYFEQEKIKNGINDGLLLQSGKAVKIVIPLAFNLPPQQRYRLIWIRRHLQEVITSQHRMAGLIATHEELEDVYRHYEKKMEQHVPQTAWSLLTLRYDTVVEKPFQAAEAIAAFLRRDLPIKAMAATVIPSLYRVKK